MFDQLCTQAILILKRAGVRRSANALFDVFYHMWADGGFDGYGQLRTVCPTKDETVAQFRQRVEELATLLKSGICD